MSTRIRLRLIAVLSALSVCLTALPVSASPAAEPTPPPAPAPHQVVCVDPSNPATCVADDSHLVDDPRFNNPNGVQLLASPKATCFGDGKSGPRVELLHVVSEKNKGRKTDAAKLQSIAVGAAKILEESSRRHGGTPKTIRFVHDKNCVPTVKKVVVPDPFFYGTTSKDGIKDYVYPAWAGITGWLTNQGYRHFNRKYVLFVDGSVGNICGLGSNWHDHEPGLKNTHNWIGGFAYIGQEDGNSIVKCWTSHTVAHELLHTLGAVQNSAPNATGHAHCTDEWDIMCYTDQSGKKMRTVCSSREWNDLADCGGDDYFNPKPAKGSYLHNYWNTYNSRFLAPANGKDPVDHTAPQVALNSLSYYATAKPKARVVIEADLFDPNLKDTTWKPTVWKSTEWMGNGWKRDFSWSGLPEGSFKLVSLEDNVVIGKDLDGYERYCETVCAIADLPHGTYKVTVTVSYEGKKYSASRTIEVGPPLKSPTSFKDTTNHVFKAEIGKLADSGVTKGCNPPANDRFCPDDYVTRGQMAAFLVRALSLSKGKATFSDTKGHIFAADIAALADAGITRGCNPPRNDRFCPDDRVTRGQMAAFLVRALKLPKGKASFKDTAGHVFAADVASLADAGITKGCNPPANDRFCPDDYVTRGQMAAFLVRALGG